MILSFALRLQWKTTAGAPQRYPVAHCAIGLLEEFPHGLMGR